VPLFPTELMFFGIFGRDVTENSNGGGSLARQFVCGRFMVVVPLRSVSGNNWGGFLPGGSCL